MVVPLVEDCRIARCILWILILLIKSLNGLKAVQQRKNLQLLNTIINVQQKEIQGIIRSVLSVEYIASTFNVFAPDFSCYF